MKSLILILSLGLLTNSVAFATGGQYQKNTGCHNSKKIGFHCHDKKGDIIQNKKAGPSKQCESMLRWLEGSRKNSKGKYISNDIWGDTVITKNDVKILVTECRK